MVVLSEAGQNDVQINSKDLEWKFSRGTGPGGQHKNKTDTAVRLIHVPTGVVTTCDGRSQSDNKKNALAVLKARLKQLELDKQYEVRHNARKSQAGSGMRGDKRRTIRVRDNKVVDHFLNKQTSYKNYVRGDLTDLR